MLVGEFYPDRLCSVLERILSARDPNIEVRVKLVLKEEFRESEKSSNDNETA